MNLQIAQGDLSKRWTHIITFEPFLFVSAAVFTNHSFVRDEEVITNLDL